MLKSILNLSNVRLLNKNEQKQIKGSDSLMCIILCGPGDGNIPIYDYTYDHTYTNAYDHDLPELLLEVEEVGCFCV